MTDNEAADIVEYLVGAYPGTYFPGPTVEVMVDALSVSDYTVAKKAAIEWVQTMQVFPTVTQLNGVIRRIAQTARERALPPAREDTHDLTREQRRPAFARGYEQARRHAGDTPEQIAAKVNQKFAEMDRLMSTRGDRKLTRR